MRNKRGNRLLLTIGICLLLLSSALIMPAKNSSNPKENQGTDSKVIVSINTCDSGVENVMKEKLFNEKILNSRL